MGRVTPGCLRTSRLTRGMKTEDISSNGGDEYLSMKYTQEPSSKKTHGIDPSVIVSSIILDISFFVSIPNSDKDVYFYAALIIMIGIEAVMAWRSSNPGRRWPMSLYIAYIFVYLLVLRCYHPNKDLKKTRGYWIIGIVMFLITLVLMVYISHSEAGKKGDETAEQGCMERVKRRLLGGESRKAKEIGVKLLIYPLMLPFLGILMAFPDVQETISGAIAPTFIAFNVITYASDLWKSFTEYIQQQAPEPSDDELSSAAAKSDMTAGVVNHDKTNLHIQIETCTSVKVMDADQQAGA